METTTKQTLMMSAEVNKKRYSIEAQTEPAPCTQPGYRVRVKVNEGEKDEMRFIIPIVQQHIEPEWRAIMDVENLDNNIVSGIGLQDTIRRAVIKRLENGMPYGLAQWALDRGYKVIKWGIHRGYFGVYRVLIERPDDPAEYVTWIYSEMDQACYHGHYFQGYLEARLDFDKR